ncbi:MAG: hypothetical protein H6Q70_4646, partial [Firmicutes bacterium]|nr:hypothetical protein [Bacillota bacterium]
YNNSTNPSQQSTQQTMMSQQNQPTNATSTQNTATKAVVGLFSDLKLAEQSVKQLRSNGFSTEEINIISKDKHQSGQTTELTDDSIMDGTMTGGAIGGVGGLLLGAGALAIPGIGPIIAAGPIAATISGAISGGIAGGLIDWGIPSEKSEVYSNQVSSGSTLAVIKTTEAKVAQAIQVLTTSGATNIETHNAK